ncbi:hypothetical protein F4778DRAFT_48393 [Xylariomycetidae sp. FL2044]|nr:hypothetical protein F4778DRAFT_48393 [Xylariomycetidae sp. FL2044]
MPIRRASSFTARAKTSSSLPDGYVSIRDVLDQKVHVGKIVKVVGLVKDFRTPIPTGSTDWKCALTIYDKTTENGDDEIVVNVFGTKENMPEPDVGDVVVIDPAKVQDFRGEISFLTQRYTVIHIYSKTSIPKPPASAQRALRPSHRQNGRTLPERDHEYVSWLYHSVDKYNLPDEAAFKVQTEQSSKTKDKFCTLKDANEGRFADVIVNVIKEPFYQDDRVTLWITDYTENDSFYKFSWEGQDAAESRDGDPYGYINTTSKAAHGWPGPFGKRAMQVTAFEPHARFIISDVRAGAWVRLRNLQFKFGRNLNNLEGFLREDRMFPDKLQVDLLNTDDPEVVGSRHKDAIRRKRDYEKLAKKQMKTYTGLDSEDIGGAKRKADDEDVQKNNSKRRRTDKRAAARKKVEEQDKRAEERLGLNPLIKCESTNQAVTPVSSIVEPILWQTTVDKQEVTLALPFTCAKYRANVRVVDFRPRKLEDFVSWRKNNEWDVLSDDSAGSSSESDEDDQHMGTLDRYTGHKTWEWHFALQLEAADPQVRGKPDRFWAVVDNNAAQQLLDLDACDLRADQGTLSKLREQLFKLWGNLEELKASEQQALIDKQKQIVARQPPQSSPPERNHTSDGDVGEISNKPFRCCIRQYGVKVPERDPSRMDAGQGRHWVRMFAVFGTKIGS